MRPDLVPGGVLPDYELPDHTSTLRNVKQIDRKTSQSGIGSTITSYLTGKEKYLCAERNALAMCQIPSIQELKSTALPVLPVKVESG